MLETYYDGTPDTIAPKLLSLLSLNGVTCSDALLCTYARHHHCEVSTFDQALIKKFTEVTTTEPTKAKMK